MTIWNIIGILMIAVPICLIGYYTHKWGHLKHILRVIGIGVALFSYGAAIAWMFSP